MPYYAPFYRPMYQPSIDQNQFSQIQQPMPQMAQQPMPTFPNVQQPQTNDIIWVQGEAGAKAYLVAPNATVTLWDSESPTIYVKSADQNGVPFMRILDFTERNAQNASKTAAEHHCTCGDKFAHKESLTALQKDFEAITGRFTALEEKFVALKKQTEQTQKGSILND